MHGYSLRTLLLLGMVASAAMAASVRFLESNWFLELTGWYGGGGVIVEVFSRRVALRLLALPAIFAVADIYVACMMPSDRRTRGFWLVAGIAYALTLVLCNEAMRFAGSARE